MSSYLRSPKYLNAKASAWEVMEMLELSATSKLPAGGMAPRIIQGIEVWVEPLLHRTAAPGVRLHKRSTHRVLAKCPTCSRVLSVGRLHQHRCDT